MIKQSPLIALIVAMAGLAPVVDAQAKDFVFGGRTTSCQQAAQYRDNQLFMDFATAIDNFDATREQRINATLTALRVDLQTLTQDMDAANAQKKRRIMVAVAGVVLGEAAGKLSRVGVKPNVSKVEKQALDALASRGADWTSVFLDYGVNGSINPASLVAMPMSLLLSFSPYGVAEKTWALGNAGIEIATAVAEADIIKGETQVTAAMVRTRAEALARKLQMPRLQEINRMKNEIDKQCG
ncbi:MAG: hypothetical protein LBJ37_24910 [Paucimonas sp.]|nr:hypothetical protein [Paucimonas sp.]